MRFSRRNDNTRSSSNPYPMSPEAYGDRRMPICDTTPSIDLASSAVVSSTACSFEERSVENREASCCPPNTSPLASCAHDPAPDADGVDRAARWCSAGSAEHQSVDAVRVSQGELLGDHSAHGQPQQMAALDFERVEQAGEVIGHVRDCVGMPG